MSLLTSVKEKLFGVKKETIGSSAMSQFRHFIGGTGFLFDKLDVFEEQYIDLHTEMDGAVWIYKNFPSVTNSVEIFTDAVLGDHLSVETDDEETRIYFENHELPKLKKSLREAVENCVITGNGYIEVLRTSIGIPLKYKPIPRSQDMYIGFSAGYDVDFYVYEMPGYKKEHEKDKEGYTVLLENGRQKTVYGIRFEPDEIIHLSYGVSELPVYGRSALASGYNIAKIMKEVLRNIAVISRYKSVAQHFITPKEPDGTEMAPNVLGKIIDEVKRLKPSQNLVSDKNFEITSLAYTGKHESMDAFIQYMDKQISNTLAPSFYTHGDVTNYAVAKEQKATYYLKIQAFRDQICEPINKIFKEIAKAKKLDENVKIDFGQFDFQTFEDERREILEKWRAGLITMGEAQEELGYPRDEELGDYYHFDLVKSPQQQPPQQSIKKLGG